MKRLLVVFSLLFPIGLLLFFAAYPVFDLSFDQPLFHFYIVTLSTFVAVVVAVFVALTLGEHSAPRHTLLATAFATMAAIFFVHGLTTPGVLILAPNPSIRWAAWLTLFTGGMVFALATFDRPGRPLQRPYLRAILWVVGIITATFILIAVLAPHWLSAVDQQVSPWHAQVIFALTLVAWAYAAFRFWQIWRVTQARTDGVMALIATWLVIGTVSLHQFATYHLSWWLYHLLILLGVTTATVALAGQYEQLRRFNLTRYYAAVGLIVTAALALLASHLFARAVYDDVVGARLTGLLIAAFSMGLLFLALLFVVRRADRLIMIRTNELARAYADLRTAEAMRDDLTDMIVHDLRSPLTAIIASLDLMERVSDKSSAKKAQEQFRTGARASAERMISMINDLLDVAKLEEGRLQPKLEPVVVSELLRERAQAFAGQAEAEGKQIAVRVPEGLPSLKVDITLMERVLDNLIGNALKYTDPGDCIELAAEQNQIMLLLSVEDSGEGVPPQDAKRIFDKFAQVTDEKGTPRRSGTGLGLAFCKLAVEAHGGRIWVDKGARQGSRFVFSLPLETQS